MKGRWIERDDACGKGGRVGVKKGEGWWLTGRERGTEGERLGFDPWWAYSGLRVIL
jgi:hypothetical protein